MIAIIALKHRSTEVKVHDMNDLGEDAKVNLKPLGRWLVSCAPGEAIGQIETGVLLGTAVVPLCRVDGRRRHLAVVNGARDHAQRHWLFARYKHVHSSVELLDSTVASRRVTRHHCHRHHHCRRHFFRSFITYPPKKEVIFSLRFGLFVCPSDNWKSCQRIFTKFLGGVGHGPMSSILVTIRITTRIRESFPVFQITIRIREELPQFYYAGVRRMSALWVLLVICFY